MPRLVYAINPDSLLVDVMIGIDGATTAALFAGGRTISAPISGRGEVDTGSNVTAVSSSILRRLGVPIKRRGVTQTASGKFKVNLFDVSVSVLDFGNPMSQAFTESTVAVMELGTPLPGVDVLIGLDFLLGYKFVLDGPAREFSLES